MPTEFEKIKSLKKSSFKNLVKDKVKILAFHYLTNKKTEHSKMDHLHYDTLEIQKYLRSTKIYPNLAKQIFKWRTRMVNFKMNFQNGSTNLLCPLGCLGNDRQDLILKCSVLALHLPELKSTKIQYKDIFSKNISKMRDAIELLSKAFKKREKLLEMSSQMSVFGVSLL